jgi:hypothetical protein
VEVRLAGEEALEIIVNSGFEMGVWRAASF